MGIDTSGKKNGEHDLTVCKECKLEPVEIKTRKCDFHPLTVCSCGNCTDRDNHECEGEEYHTREVLQCPFHLLVDCLRRIKMGIVPQHIHSISTQAYISRKAPLPPVNQPGTPPGK